MHPQRMTVQPPNHGHPSGPSQTATQQLIYPGQVDPGISPAANNVNCYQFDSFRGTDCGRISYAYAYSHLSSTDRLRMS